VTNVVWTATTCIPLYIVFYNCDYVTVLGRLNVHQAGTYGTVAETQSSDQSFGVQILRSVHCRIQAHRLILCALKTVSQLLF